MFSILQLEELGFSLDEVQYLLADGDIAGSIYKAVSQSSPERPEWAMLAGRLLMYDRQKKLDVDAIMNDVREGVYHEKISSIPEKKLSTLLRLSRYADRDMIYDYAGANMLVERYLHGTETPQIMYIFTAIILADSYSVIDVYNALSLRKISLATPMLANLRFANKNVASCFISRMYDDLDSIMNGVKTVARVSKNGGGIGMHLSRIRARGSTVAGTPNASGGIIPFIKIVNDTAVAVNQQGKRAGACTVAIDSWHKDIDHFLDLQTENGDQRGKAYDVYPQVCVSDEFMRRVEGNMAWSTFCPYEVKEITGIDLNEIYGEKFAKAYKEIEANEAIPRHTYKSARDLMKSILKTQVETGMPYIFFKDTANEDNLNKNTGIIDCGNLCMESFSSMTENEDHTCNLISVNFAECEDAKEVFDMSKLATHLLNSALEIGVTPVENATNHNNKNRTIGVGVMGYADHLARIGVKYSKSKKVLRELMYALNHGCIVGSHEVAKVKRSYPNFFYNQRWWGEWLSKTLTKEDLESLSPDGTPVIVANGELTAIAPNSSTSIIMGCSASLLPIYDTFFIEKNQKGFVPRVAKYYDRKFHYETMKQVEQQAYIEICAEAQQYVTQGISMELMFDLNKGLTAKYIYDTILYAWRKRCKSIYYIRSIQKKLDSEEDCSSCSS